MATEFEGPLAEYAALRAEILHRNGTQQNLLTLQLTITGAIFSFALSTSTVYLLLVVPLSTYMLVGRYLGQQAGVMKCSTYIRTELTNRVPGGFGWEAWIRDQHPQLRNLWALNPLFITFPGSALIALVIVAPPIFRGLPNFGWSTVGLIVGWLAGLGLMTASFRFTWKVVGHSVFFDLGRDAEVDEAR